MHPFDTRMLRSSSLSDLRALTRRRIEDTPSFPFWSTRCSRTDWGTWARASLSFPMKVGRFATIKEVTDVWSQVGWSRR